LGFDGGITIVKDYLQAVRAESKNRRAYVRMEPGPGERFEVDWGHFGALLYNGNPRKLYAFCLVECHSRKIYLEFTHSQSFETFVPCHTHAFAALTGCAREIWFDNLATGVTQPDPIKSRAVQSRWHRRIRIFIGRSCWSRSTSRFSCMEPAA
jgi:transposase